MSAALVDERIRDLRAAAGRAHAGRRARIGGAGTGRGADPAGGGRPSLVHRAARALTGHRLRPA